MRAHGDPNQAEPTIDAAKVIHLTMAPAIPGGMLGTNKGGQGDTGPGQYCRTYLANAETALFAGGQPPQPPNQTQLVQFAQCMRAKGVPDFPDPTNGSLQLPAPGSNAGSADLNQNSATYKNAAKLCTQNTGAYVPGAGGPAPAGSIIFDGGPLPVVMIGG
jgi:hypothetical protein